MTSLEIMQHLAIRLVGTPYRWGGNHVLEGYDCSGFVLDLLRAGARWPSHNDASAQEIYNVLKRDGRNPVPAQAGALAFYGQTRQTITHVGFCMNDTVMAEAGGGDQFVTDAAAAVKRGAVVRVRSIKARADFLDCLLP